MESACSVGDPGSIPGLGRSPREGNGNLLHYFYLKNPVDGEPCRLWSMELQRFRHDWMTNTTLYIHICICTFIYVCVHIYTHNLFIISIIYYYKLLNIVAINLCFWSLLYMFTSVHFSLSVVSDSLWPQDCITPGLPVHHKLPEFT